MKKQFKIDKMRRVKNFLEKIRNDIIDKIDEIIELIPDETVFVSLSRYLWKKIDDINKFKTENSTSLTKTKIFFMESKLNFLNNRISSAHNITPIMRHSKEKNIKYNCDNNNIEERKGNLIPKFSFKEKEVELNSEENIIKELKKIETKSGNLFNEYLKKRIMSSKINNNINDNSFIKDLSIIYYISKDKREINYSFKCVGNKEYFEKYSLGIFFPIDFNDNFSDIKLINFSSSKNELKCDIIEKKQMVKIHNFTLSENEEININIKVSSTRENKINLYSKEQINIWKGAYNAKANISIIFLDNIICCSMANGLFKYSNSIDKFYYNGLIPENGLKEIAMVTQKKTKIKITQELTSKRIKIKNNETKFNADLEDFFKKNYNIEHQSLSIYKDGIFQGIINTPFNKCPKTKININNVKEEVKLIHEIIIENEYNKIFHIPEKYLSQEISNQERKFFYPIAIDILINSKEKLPIPIIIGKWVYKNIIYTKEYSKKILTAKEIYNERKGVCDHKTILYNTLLLSLGIPSIYASGFVIDGNNKNNNIDPTHAWSIIYYKKEWINIDVTWNILSGKLPISHIFKCFGDKYIISTSEGFNNTMCYKVENIYE